MTGTVNSDDEDIAKVGAALADAAHAGALSDGYYRAADDVLKRIDERLREHEANAEAQKLMADAIASLTCDLAEAQERVERLREVAAAAQVLLQEKAGATYVTQRDKTLTLRQARAALDALRPGDLGEKES